MTASQYGGEVMIRSIDRLGQEAMTVAAWPQTIWLRGRAAVSRARMARCRRSRSAGVIARAPIGRRPRFRRTTLLRVDVGVIIPVPSIGCGQPQHRLWS